MRLIKKQLKNKKAFQEKLFLRGFTLSIAVIIMSVLLTVSFGMSVLLLRDLKQASIAETSSNAYNLADGLMSCIVSYEKNIRVYDDAGNDLAGIFPTSTEYTYDYRYKDLITKKNYKQNSLTCFGEPVLNISSSEMNSTQIILANEFNSPLGYAGGVKTVINIQTDEMKNNEKETCLQAEVYSHPSKDKLFITRAKTPCTGNKVIERVIARYVQ